MISIEFNRKAQNNSAMPSTIPFDPGLVLGQVIDETKIQSLKGKADILKVKDAKENQLQQTMLAQQRLEMLKKELINMKIDPNDSSMKSLDDQLTAMKSDVAAKAKEFAEASVTAAQQMAAADASAPQSQINEEPESPIDFSNSSLVNMDLSSDTMTMNVQVRLFFTALCQPVPALDGKGSKIPLPMIFTTLISFKCPLRWLSPVCKS